MKSPIRAVNPPSGIDLAPVTRQGNRTLRIHRRKENP
jgi:hypothetical protein